MLSPRATCPESVISRTDFVVASRIFKDSLICFEVAAEEIISGKRHTRVEPVRYIIDPDSGELFSDFELNADRTGLSKEGCEDYVYDRNHYDRFLEHYVTGRNGLLAHMIGRLSQESALTLDTKSGPDGFEVSKISKDTFHIWQLIELTHMIGSSRSK